MEATRPNEYRAFANYVSSLNVLTHKYKEKDIIEIVAKQLNEYGELEEVYIEFKFDEFKTLVQNLNSLEAKLEQVTN